MLIDFIKMQAQGNDFLILDQLAEQQTMDYSALAVAICKPHTGFGADGLVLLQQSATDLCKMVIYNNDGSRAAMCGSALRCLTKLAYDKYHLEQFSIETDSGSKSVQVCQAGDDLLITVNLGKPELLESTKQVGQITGSLVDVGNLHYVIYQDSIEDDPHLKWGSWLEHHAAFAESVNVHFVQLIAKNRIRIKIWENAVGPTLACGTGATACVLTGITLHGLDDVVTVEMPGGEVTITLLKDDGQFLLTGPVETTGSGTYQWKI